MAQGRDLHSLIRLSRWTVDDVRRRLALLVEREEELVAARRALEKELARERVAALNVMEGGLSFGGYMLRYRMRCDELDQQIVEAGKEIAAVRDSLVEAYREQKAYELAQDARDKAQAEELEHREQLSLDEAARNLHCRRKENDV